MKKHLFAFLVLSMLLYGCAEKTEKVSEDVQIANPASVYCGDQGGMLEIRTASDGSQAGYCIFSDGTECEEWAFYRGECPKKEEPVISEEEIVTPEAEAFTIEADDIGFYTNGEDISSITVSKGGEVEIIFKVLEDNVYYGGLDFRGCGVDSGGIRPGMENTVNFVAKETCTITSYWPTSGVVKDDLKVIVQ